MGHDIQENNLGRTVLPKVHGQTVTPADYAVFQNLDTMEAHLLANGYTAAQLLTMTFNDKVYACKLSLGIPS